jgi:hypothetical protein
LTDTKPNLVPKDVYCNGVCDCMLNYTDWLNNTTGMKHLKSHSTKPSLFK